MNTDIVLIRPMNALNSNDLKVFMLKIITYCYRVTGYQSNSEDIAFQVNEMVSDYSKTSMTLAQIQEALTNGVKGKYGEFTGLSVMTYNKWIAAYKQEKPNLSTNRLIAESRKPVTDADKKKIAEESIEMMISHFRKTGKILNYGNSNYNYLVRIGEIKICDDFEDLYREQARENILNQLEAERDAASQKLDRGEIKKLNASIQSFINEVNNSLVDIEMGNLALRDYLMNKIR